ncbi:MAG: SagB family peptide dehydrogenase, partial [Actinomycetota bacterium]|nr:SagB family peptide dehydrogenase [Actinomycetota bacterium]
REATSTRAAATGSSHGSAGATTAATVAGMGIPAHDYHERTKHSVTDLRGGQPLEWADKPLPYKRYTNVPPLPLPLSWPEPEVPAGVALSSEVIARTRQLGLPDLARLLFLSAGVTRRHSNGHTTTFFRAAPSAGALYPVELYMVCGGLPELPAGVYHFEPVEFALRRLRSGDLRASLALAAANSEIAEHLVTIVLTGIPWRTTWKYGARGYRHLFWDAGTILANTIAAAASAGLLARVLVGFVDAEVTHFLGLDNPSQEFAEYPLAIVPLSLPALARPPGPPARPGPEPPPATELPALELDVAQLSRQQVDEPELHAVHAAGTLDSPAAVSLWRRSVRERGSPSAAGKVRAPSEAAGTVDEVILRRGSTRRFTRTSVPAATLSWGIAAASRGLHADFLAQGETLLIRFLAVQAVDDLESGVYRWNSDGLQLFRRGLFRAEVSRVCLDQRLGGDAAFTLFECAELDALLRAAGTRAYRAAQLEAGIVAGWLQLVAFAHGVGGTGLTFYDDEVRAFLDTSAEPMLTVAVGVPGYDATPGKRPSELPPWRLERWGWGEPWS